MRVKHIKGGVTAPRGFLAAGIHAGVKPESSLDLALVTSQCSGPIAGVFTKNLLPAAPVVLDRQKLKNGVGQAIIINSGNANAFTGRQGLRDAREMANLVAQHLAIPRATVFVGSTGIIGHPLPMFSIRQWITSLVQRLSRAGHREASLAIMTTDTRPKEVAFQSRIGGKVVTVGGMAKGSGMIHPDMATMLAYLTTDVAIGTKALQQALRKAVEDTFNCISIDGDTSPNDTVLCLANGLAGNAVLKTGQAEFHTFQTLLHQVCHSLALQVCRDGEGCTKVVQILVTGTKTRQEAKRVCTIVATSPLVKTAIFGEDPNWGRIIAAIGRAGVSVQPQHLTIRFNDMTVVHNGMGLGAEARRQAKRVMRQKDFNLSVSLGKGPGTYRMWTTDLSHEYVTINASYSS